MPRTCLMIFDAKNYLLSQPNNENTPFPDYLLDENCDLLIGLMSKVNQGFQHVVLAETRPTAEQTKFTLPVLQQAFQHKLGNKVEVVFDPFWQKISKSANTKIENIATKYVEARGSQLSEADARSIIDSMKSLSSVLALIYRTVAAFPADEIEIRFLANHNKDENKKILDFFALHKWLLPKTVKKITLHHTEQDENGSYLGEQCNPDLSGEGIYTKPINLDPTLNHTTALAWHEQHEFPQEMLMDGAKIISLLPTELPPVVETPPTIEAAAPAPTPIVAASTNAPTVSLDKIIESQRSGLKNYKEGKKSIEAFLMEYIPLETSETFTDADILKILLTIAKNPTWKTKGTASPLNPWSLGKKQVPTGIQKMRNSIYPDLTSLVHDIKTKLEADSSNPLSGIYQPRDKSTDEFYQLIVALHNPRCNNILREVGIRAYCERFSIGFEATLAQASLQPATRGNSMRANNS